MASAQLEPRELTAESQKSAQKPRASPSPVVVLLALTGPRPRLLPLQPSPVWGRQEGEDSLAVVTHSAGL